jgi:hypothetical protein
LGSSPGDARARRRGHRQQQLGIRPRPTAAQALYGLSKAGVTHLTRSAAAEVGKQGIRVNEIAPALVMSEMVKQYFEGPNAIPLDPVIAKLALDHVGQPEDGAAAVLFLCSEQANYITGVVLPVDGGFLLHNAGPHKPARAASCSPSPNDVVGQALGPPGRGGDRRRPGALSLVRSPTARRPLASTWPG